MQQARALYAREGKALPEIVFWNLRGTGSRGAPVLALEQGVAMASGFSPALLTQLLEKGTIDPIDVVERAFSKRLFQRLRVVRTDNEAHEIVMASLALECTVDRDGACRDGAGAARAQGTPEACGLHTFHELLDNAVHAMPDMKERDLARTFGC